MKALIIDTETTGISDPRPVEIAYIEVDDANVFFDDLDTVAENPRFESRFNPGCLIDPGAMAVHHITDEIVAGCEPHTSFRLPQGIGYLIGHNIDFDYAALKTCGPIPEIKRICTLAMARALWPELTSHKLGAILYHFDRDYATSVGKNSHEAMADTLMTARLLKMIINRLTIDEPFRGDHLLHEAEPTLDWLWKWCEYVRMPDRMPFGKHRGMKIDMVPADYKRWLLAKDDVDPYLRKALESSTGNPDVPSALV